MRLEANTYRGHDSRACQAGEGCLSCLSFLAPQVSTEHSPNILARERYTTGCNDSVRSEVEHDSVRLQQLPLPSSM